jgi:ABC-type branched-subunit amino acid transport system ATPase component
MAESLLSVLGIHTYYGDSYVLQGLSLELREGSIVAILGRNGMGKTTLIRSVAGLAPPREGDIRFKGASLRGRQPYAIAQAGIALVPQGRRIFRSLSVRENLLLPTSDPRAGAPCRPAAWRARARVAGAWKACSRNSRSSPSASTIPVARSRAASSRCSRSGAR